MPPRKKENMSLQKLMGKYINVEASLEAPVSTEMQVLYI